MPPRDEAKTKKHIRRKKATRTEDESNIHDQRDHDYWKYYRIFGEPVSILDKLDRTKHRPDRSEGDG